MEVATQAPDMAAEVNLEIQPEMPMGIFVAEPVAAPKDLAQLKDDVSEVVYGIRDPWCVVRRG